jgi:membrane protease YdiL (CAAX protease family)
MDNQGSQISGPPRFPASRSAQPLPSGARVALYLIVVFFLWVGFVPLATARLLSFSSREFVELCQELLLFLTAFIPAAFLSFAERRPIADYGLPVSARSLMQFSKGCLFGLAEISALIGLISVGGGYSFGTIALRGSSLWTWSGYWLVFFFFVGLAEEFAFRGYAQFTLAQSIGVWPAAIVLSAGFGAVHLNNPGESWIGIVDIVGTGLLLALTLKRTGDLWLAVGWHAAFDFGESFLFSAPDSGTLLEGHLSNAALHGPAWLTGGTVGPEGSIFSFITMAAAALFIHKVFPPRRSASSPV